MMNFNTSTTLTITRENNSFTTRNYSVHPSSSPEHVLYHVHRPLTSSSVSVYSGPSSSYPLLAKISFPRKSSDIVLTLSSAVTNTSATIELRSKGLTSSRWNFSYGGRNYVWREHFLSEKFVLHADGKDGEVCASMKNKKFSFHWRQIGEVEVKKGAENREWVDLVVVCAVALQELEVRKTDKELMNFDGSELVGG